jgi:hypothetical protein
MENVRWTQNKKTIKFLQIFIGGSLTVWLLALIFLPEIDRLLSIPAYVSVSVGLIWLIDKYLLIDVDLINEFKNKNYNVGMWLIALAIVIVGALAIIS